jgi:hypothetical protein
MKHWLLFVSCIALCIQLRAQQGRQLPLLYDDSGGLYWPRGFYLAPGLTYTLPAPSQKDDSLSVGADTLAQGSFTARGRMGLALELGHAHFLPHWMPFEYVDYGLGFKWFRGKEEFSGQYLSRESSESLAELASAKKFSDGWLSAGLNVGKFIQLRDYSFLLVSGGANADFRVFGRRDTSGFNPFESSFTENFIAQAHLRIGYGFKLQPNLFVIPILETPILNAIPFESGRSTLAWFNSRYRPFVLTIRFQWLSRRKPADCTGKPSRTEKHELWDPSMRRFKRK